MFNHIGPQNLIHLQRSMALKLMGLEVKRLYDEGYPVDADRMLDEMNERRRSWDAEEVS